MATFAIGDIHGWRQPLDDLLGAIRPRLQSGDTVVFLGDYIDRGPDVKGCVESILGFIDEVPAEVVCLCGNHEEWLLRTMRDHTSHKWLLGMEAYDTIQSYSPDAARAIRSAARQAGMALYEEERVLPYEAFFDVLPEPHVRFFESLRPYHVTPDCLCAHAGLDPRVQGMAKQGRALTWGVAAFPHEYAGPHTVVYGHKNNAHLDDDDWPHPRIVGRTFGVDTIAHGVLTALALPGPHVFQSARYEDAVRGRGGDDA
jgi:serine/threonine protein phosphatase 1